MPLSDCGAISSSWLSFLSSDILACYERSFHLSRCLKEWGQLTQSAAAHAQRESPNCRSDSRGRNESVILPPGDHLSTAMNDCIT
jgi:hypothetical protein